MYIYDQLEVCLALRLQGAVAQRNVYSDDI